MLKRKSRKQKQAEQVESNAEDMMLAGRDINYFIGIFTMTATWVGGGYINGKLNVSYLSPSQQQKHWIL